MLKRLLLGYALIVFFLASGSPIVEQHIANTLDGLLTAVNGTVVGLSDAVNENLNLSLRAIIAIIPPGPLQTSFIQLLNDVEKLENSVAEDKQTVISNIRKAIKMIPTFFPTFEPWTTDFPTIIPHPHTPWPTDFPTPTPSEPSIFPFLTPYETKLLLFLFDLLEDKDEFIDVENLDELSPSLLKNSLVVPRIGDGLSSLIESASPLPLGSIVEHSLKGDPSALTEFTKVFKELPIRGTFGDVTKRFSLRGSA